jgi:glycosyltransferase involved in cell wall biosynthesis
MRIGLNILYLKPGKVGGTETYASGLLAGLATVNHQDEFFVFTNHESIGWPIPDVPNMIRVPCPVHATNRIRRYWFEQTRLRKYLRQHRIDVLHSLGYVSPLWVHCPTIVTVPDLNFIALGKQMRLLRRIGLAVFVSLSILRSARCLTLSNFSMQSIRSTYHLRPEKIVLTYLAPRIDEKPFAEPQIRRELQTLGLEKPYIAAFCSVSPHKNIDTLIQAYQIARRTYGIPHHLVLIGHPPPKSSNWSSLPEVHCLDYIPDRQVRAVLSQADLLAFPSRYEGFGLPVLEAMKLGTPVVSSSAASLPEVVGDAALLFDPDDAEEMAEKIATVAQNPEEWERLRHKGHENFSRFSWEDTARKTMDVYRQVFADSGKTYNRK